LVDDAAGRDRADIPAQRHRLLVAVGLTLLFSALVVVGIVGVEPGVGGTDIRRAGRDAVLKRDGGRGRRRADRREGLLERRDPDHRVAILARILLDVDEAAVVVVDVGSAGPR